MGPPPQRVEADRGMGFSAGEARSTLGTAVGGSAEYREFWSEMERAKSQYRPSQTMNFYVDPAQGHDDFLMSLALVIEAANQYEPRVGRGSSS